MLQESVPDALGTHVRAQTGKLGGDLHKNLALIFGFAFCRLQFETSNSIRCLFYPYLNPRIYPKFYPVLLCSRSTLLSAKPCLAGLYSILPATTHAAS